MRDRKLLMSFIMLLMMSFLFGCVGDEIDPTIEVANDISIEVGDDTFDITDFVVIEDDIDGEIAIVSSMIDYGDFDYNKVGEYTVSITVMDVAENEVTKEIVVKVEDTTAPSFDEIENQTLEAGTPDQDWSTFMANVEDVGDTTVVTEEVQDQVDYDTPGTYTVIVKAVDDSLNEFSRSFSVEIVDRTVPIVGPQDSQTIEAGSEDVDWTLFVTAINDNSDGQLFLFEETDNVIYDEVGEYSVLLQVVDESGNMSHAVLQVFVEDTTAPVIVMAGESNLFLEYNAPYEERGATCTDTVLIDCVVVMSGDTVDTSVLGTYVIQFNVTDSAGNQAIEVTRTVVVSDTTAPVITLIGQTEIHVEYGNSYIDQGVTCVENYDTECNVVTQNLVDPFVLGTYTITYNSTDSEGNATQEVTRTVIVEDTTAPVLAMQGTMTVELEYNEAFVDEGVLCTDNYDTECIVVIGGAVVDETVSGTYLIIYTATDSQGNTVVITRTVIVKDAVQYTAISDIYREAILSDYIGFTGIVVNVYDGGYFVSDGVNAIAVYVGNNNLGVQNGDEVEVKGYYAAYNSLRQISQVTLQEILSSGNPNPFETMAEEKTVAQMNDLDSTDPTIHGKYYTVTGVLELVGQNNNVALVDGDELITVYYYSDPDSLSALEGHIGQVVEITVVYYTDHGLNGVLVSYDGKEEGITVVMTEQEAFEYDILNVPFSVPSVTIDGITLPTEAVFGTTFSDWTSSDTSVLADDGTFVGFGVDDVIVTFTAIASRGGLSQIVTVDVLVPVLSTVAEVLEMDEDSYFYVSGVIYEISYYGFFIEDQGQYLFIYNKSADHDFQVGDEITLVGKLFSYSGLLQASLMGNVELNSSGNPDLVSPIDGSVEGIQQDIYPRGSRVTVTATLTREGLYNNIYLNGVAGGKVVVYYRSNEAALVPLEGDTVTVTVVTYHDGVVLFQEEAVDVITGATFSDEVIAQSVADLIDLGDIDNIRDDLILPTSSADPVATITWISTDYEAINGSGAIYRQPGMDVLVTLTATVTVGLESVTREFHCTVIDSLNVDALVIGTNIYTLNDNYYNALVFPELNRYAEERGITILFEDSFYNQATLNDQVDWFITQGVDALVINLVDPAGASTIIDKAKAADIPLIFYGHSEPTEPGVMETYDKVWYVGVGEDDGHGGIEQGQMIVADWQANSDWDLNADGVIDYVLLKGEPGHPYAEARTMESVQALIDAGYTVNELALSASPTWSTADANNTMDAWLTSSFANQIELVICNNDGMAFGAIAALSAAGFDIPVYGIDGIDEAFDDILSGTMQGTVYNDGEEMAKTALDLAINAALGIDVLTGTDYVLDDPATKAVRIPYVIVTIDNVEDFID